MLATSCGGECKLAGSWVSTEGGAHVLKQRGASLQAAIASLLADKAAAEAAAAELRRTLAAARKGLGVKVPLPREAEAAAGSGAAPSPNPDASPADAPVSMDGQAVMHLRTGGSGGPTCEAGAGDRVCGAVRPVAGQAGGRVDLGVGAAARASAAAAAAQEAAAKQRALDALGALRRAARSPSPSPTSGQNPGQGFTAGPPPLQAADQSNSPVAVMNAAPGCTQPLAAERQAEGESAGRLAEALAERNAALADAARLSSELEALAAALADAQAALVALDPAGSPAVDPDAPARAPATDAATNTSDSGAQGAGSRTAVASVQAGWPELRDPGRVATAELAVQVGGLEAAPTVVVTSTAERAVQAGQGLLGPADAAGGAGAGVPGSGAEDAGFAAQLAQARADLAATKSEAARAATALAQAKAAAAPAAAAAVGGARAHNHEVGSRPHSSPWLPKTSVGV